MELERKDVALKEVQLSKRSLQNEINALKGILDGEDINNEGEIEDDEDDDEEVEIAAKETIIARDREIAKLREELDLGRERSRSLKEEADK